jgi:hypothetical protein
MTKKDLEAIVVELAALRVMPMPALRSNDLADRLSKGDLIEIIRIVSAHLEVEDIESRMSALETTANLISVEQITWENEDLEVRVERMRSLLKDCLNVVNATNVVLQPYELYTRLIARITKELDS